MRTIENIFKQIESVPDFSGQTITSVNYKNVFGDNPLHVVCCWGDCEAIEILISAGADINAKGESGFTPLHCAAEQNQPDAVKLLIQLGAKIAQDDGGETALELAKSLGNAEAINAFPKDI